MCVCVCVRARALGVSRHARLVCRVMATGIKRRNSSGLKTDFKSARTNGGAAQTDGAALATVPSLAGGGPARSVPGSGVDLSMDVGEACVAESDVSAAVAGPVGVRNEPRGTGPSGIAHLQDDLDDFEEGDCVGDSPVGGPGMKFPFPWFAKNHDGTPSAAAELEASTRYAVAAAAAAAGAPLLNFTSSQ